MNEQLGLNSVSFECPEYEKNGSFESTNVVITPIRVIASKTSDGRPEYIIFQGCSMYQTCQSLKCVFSSASRDAAKERRLH